MMIAVSLCDAKEISKSRLDERSHFSYGVRSNPLPAQESETSLSRNNAPCQSGRRLRPSRAATNAGSGVFADCSSERRAHHIACQPPLGEIQCALGHSLPVQRIVQGALQVRSELTSIMPEKESVARPIFKPFGPAR